MRIRMNKVLSKQSYGYHRKPERVNNYNLYRDLGFKVVSRSFEGQFYTNMRNKVMDIMGNLRG